jgi:tetratricopeptide (TPR) repeat protein
VGVGAKATSPPAHYNLGLVYYEQHRPEMAIAEYQAAIQLYPKVCEPHAIFSALCITSSTS